MKNEKKYNKPGKKYDQGKRDFTLLPWEGVEKVVEVLEFGAGKYGRDNWRKLENGQQRNLAAAQRHLVAMMQGKETDKESGLSHAAHAICCLLFVLAGNK